MDIKVHYVNVWYVCTKCEEFCHNAVECKQVPFKCLRLLDTFYRLIFMRWCLVLSNWYIVCRSQLLASVHFHINFSVVVSVVIAQTQHTNFVLLLLWIILLPKKKFPSSQFLHVANFPLLFFSSVCQMSAGMRLTFKSHEEHERYINNTKHENIHSNQV